MYTVNRKSWHYRLNRFMWGYQLEKRRDLCSYWSATVISIFVVVLSVAILSAIVVAIYLFPLMALRATMIIAGLAVTCVGGVFLIVLLSVLMSAIMDRVSGRTGLISTKWRAFKGRYCPWIDYR